MKTFPFLIALFVAAATCLNAAETKLKVGDPAPKVQGIDHDEKPWKLSDILAKKKAVLLYFYPKDIRRMWVNEKTKLPVRYQYYNYEFPDFGNDVLMSEYAFSDFGKDFDDQLFEFEPTDAELSELGLTREALSQLSPDSAAFELVEPRGLEFHGYVQDDNGKRPVSGTIPTLLLHHHRKGNVYLNIRTKSGESARFEVRVNGNRFYSTAERIFIFLRSSDGSSGLMGLPLEAEDFDPRRHIGE